MMLARSLMPCMVVHGSNVGAAQPYPIHTAQWQLIWGLVATDIWKSWLLPNVPFKKGQGFYPTRDSHFSATTSTYL